MYGASHKNAQQCDGQRNHNRISGKLWNGYFGKLHYFASPSSKIIPRNLLRIEPRIVIIRPRIRTVRARDSGRGGDIGEDGNRGHRIGNGGDGGR